MSAPYAQYLSEGTLQDRFDSERVIMEAAQSPAKLQELIACLGDPNEVVRARACAILERITRANPRAAQASGKLLVDLATSKATWLIRMNVARMAPLIDWNPTDYEKILAFLFEEAEKQSGFVAAWAIDALARFSKKDESIRPRVRYMLEEARDCGSASVRARAKRYLREPK
ncbi:MAG TPA: hypothetical protein VG944_02335 [Fimbriimonas sp.]|nr:hypothetical protein [Fimbriimonas sp.]